jgi:hypothetical protein
VVELSGGPHVSYAIQWVLFALLALGGLVKFLGDDLREIEAAGRPPALAAGADNSGSVVPGGVGPTGPLAR